MMEEKMKTQQMTSLQTQTKVQTANKVKIRVPLDGDEDLKAIYKILKRPRSRKYMKALAIMDTLSQGDKAIIAELKKRAGAEADSEMVFTPEDMEAFKNSIESMIEEEIRKEEEALRLAEKERRRNTLVDIISPCGLPDCVIHRIDKAGRVLKHYAEGDLSSLPEVYRVTRDIVMEYGGFSNWSCVEIYESCLVHRTAKGDTIKIYELEDEE